MMNSTTLQHSKVDVSFEAVASSLIPGLSVPPSANNAFMLGYGMILLANFTTTYNHAFLRYLRLLLAVPAIYGLWDYGYSGFYSPTGKVNVEMGMAHIANFGVLKVVEICLLGFWNKPEDWPKWVKLGKTEKKADDGKPLPREVVPFTPTIWGRLCYAYDLMTACGSSWFPGLAWNFAPSSYIHQNPKAKPQLQFFLSSLWLFAETYMTLDVIETIMSSRKWNTMEVFPVTSLPIPQQLVFALCVCVSTCLSINIAYVIMALIASMIGIPSTAFPPIFNRPFRSTSLAEFWSIRWHAIFRRPFNKWSEAIMYPPTKYFKLSERTSKFTRAAAIFFMSYGMHLILVWIVPERPNYPPHDFLNLQAAKFFLAQPLGLSIELLVAFPLTKALPNPWRKEARRLFAWCWLLWTGRFWSDVWISRGLMGYAERYIRISPVRGLLRGQWIV